MPAFTGTLNTNEMYAGLFNAYRLIKTISDNLDAVDTSLAARYRTDGGMYHDKSVFTDMDIVSSREWDPTDTNVLEPEAKVAPVQQEIVVNQKRQIGLYSENYLTKRAWMDVSAFEAFNSVVQQQVGNTKKVYEQRLVDVFVGTTTANKGKQLQTVDITTAVGKTTGEEKNRLTAQAIAQKIADLEVDLKDSTRDYNDYGFMKAFNSGDFDIVWNASYANMITKLDLPTIFHKDGLFKDGTLLPARYFGAQSTAGTADGTTHRAMDEYKITVGNDGKYLKTGTKVVNVFPGDLLPESTPIVEAGTALTTRKITNTSTQVYDTVYAYTANAKVICKIIHKDAVKYLSSFETSTEFWNPKNLSTNRYLTWMFASPDRLYAYPYITLEEA